MADIRQRDGHKDPNGVTNEIYETETKFGENGTTGNGVDAGEKKEPIKLQRQLGLVSGTAIIVGSMIGSGIFISPKGVLAQTESVGMSLVVWTLCGVVAMFGALCFAELGTIIPKSGGEYAYLNTAFGGGAAFLFSWTANIVLKPSSLAIIILACVDYALQPFYEGTECGPPQMAKKLMAACAIILVVGLNCWSAKLASMAVNFFTVAKLAALCIIIIVGFIEMGKGNTEYLDPKVSFKSSTSNILAYAIAFYQGLWAYDGWNQLNYVTEELQNPMKNLPRAICIGIPLVTVVYLLTNIAYFTVLSPEELLQSPAVAVTFANRTLGVMAWIIPMSVVFSTFGAAVAVVYSAGRLPYVAAREGHMISILSYASIHRRTPVPSVMWLGIVAIIMIIPGSIEELINYFNFAAWMFYGGAIAGLLWLRYKFPEWKRPIKAPLPIPIIMVLASAYFVIAPVIDEPAIEFLFAALFIVAGLILYFPFVHYRKELPFMDKLTTSLQLFLEVVPSGVNDDDEED